MGEKCSDHRQEIGFQINTLSHMVRRLVHRTVFSEDRQPLTRMQGWIIGYLYENRDRDVFQRDVQNHFAVQRSTMTGILQLMEKNGLVRRGPVDGDARLKKLELTPEAVRGHELFQQGVDEAEAALSAALTPSEQEEFLRLCEKLKTHIESIENGKGRKAT